MSLINDAIKRAGQTPTPPPNPAETAAGMRPIEYERPAKFPWAIVVAVLTPVFGLAIWFIVKGWELSKPNPTPGVAVNAREQAAPPQTTPATVPFVVPQVPQLPVTTNSAAVVVAQAPALPAEPPKPSFATLKLQGIFWRPSKPSAVINAKTVYIGDRIETARVTAIDQESVTLQCESETKVLTLQ